ncbi:MAG: hypothetical protein WBW04_05405 [Nitrolancea sp.]
MNWDYRKVAIHVTLLIIVIAAGVVIRMERDKGAASGDPIATDPSGSSVAVVGTSTATKKPSKNDPTPTKGPSPTPSPTSTPTPIPTPTPTPVPPPLARCYQPRQEPVQTATPATIVTPGTVVVGSPESGTPESTPEASPTPSAPQVVLSPADKNSIFQNCQVIAYYGFPDVPQMGIVGEYDTDTLVQKLRAQAQAYDDVNGSRGVAPAIHLIYAVAQADQTADGTYLARMSDDMVNQWIGIAEKYDLLLILDIQMGSSSVEQEFPHVLPFLKNPRVHLGLDPEFVVSGDQAPGIQIGSLDVSQINKAEDLLQQLVEENHLPNKILIVHQFLPDMILNKEQMENKPNVDVVIDQDGFGGPELKSANYEHFVKADGAEHGGFKLFYKQDDPLMTPEEVEQLDPQPDVIIYQ